jgi:hypothetical protein
MPWKAGSVLDEKLRFVFEYERDEQTMAELCAGFGKCRDTGYVCCGATASTDWLAWRKWTGLRSVIPTRRLESPR